MDLNDQNARFAGSFFKSTTLAITKSGKVNPPRSQDWLSVKTCSMVQPLRTAKQTMAKHWQSVWYEERSDMRTSRTLKTHNAWATKQIANR
jgi:hypothetical protein